MVSDFLFFIAGVMFSQALPTKLLAIMTVAYAMVLASKLIK